MLKRIGYFSFLRSFVVRDNIYSVVFYFGVYILVVVFVIFVILGIIFMDLYVVLFIGG